MWSRSLHGDRDIAWSGFYRARRGAVAARQAHNLEVAGSSPAAANKASVKAQQPTGSLDFPWVVCPVRCASLLRLLLPPVAPRFDSGGFFRIGGIRGWAKILLGQLLERGVRRAFDRPFGVVKQFN